ncbi:MULTISPECIES: UDP-glucose 4-epimerase GalE [unclassified Commensalibacter]|uniref:UDP-glucose 4-epimerase GalE n=1 Tax=unclassified Commensalibacter TaxID=2630218 RepID=UPI0018DD2D09|nr:MULTISPECIES: UDP-glucose 4-epimerase GalE [unclassified Commensalibacter]MBH9969526.1 UDP-glucose 4-epimerase GalE [Commensalibacter sp. M0265]MBH9976881.1 UDP-glucose 4-epimerase GalE [Commensalibacter sp. M0266]MBH9992182.1 UDP-glucose 4-epimerase GalE [Commensalibacter sp. M0270]MBI0046057.1 UDP-glucose 4-epimerase GalE [Commensalibacter sp. M0267]MBI0055726.1 UDP-glucose 4-epimerase GalE [Commensalibacter sp. M0268]
MTILVTGGCGYIGSHTCIQLIKQGIDPVIIDNLYNGKEIVLDRIKKITGKRPRFYQGDIRNKDLLDTIFKENNIDGVIHFAGLKAVGESVRKPLEYYDVNVYGTINLLDAMKKANIKKFIFSSSATVYGTQPIIPYIETMETGEPTQPYGRSKLFIEKILQDLSIADQDWSITILRYFNPVGAHPSGLIGEDPQGIPNNLMPYITQVAIGKLASLAVFGNDYETRDGTCIRDFIHVMDLAEGHLAALNYNDTQSGVNIFNLGSGQGNSVLEVIATFENVFRKKLPYHFAPRRDGDLPAYWANADRAKKLLNWETKLNLHDMVQDSWNWQSKNPNGFEE